MAHPSQLIVIVLISSRPAMKRPINLPRNLRLSELKPLCVEVTRVQLRVDHVDREDTGSQQVLQENCLI